MEEEGSQCGGAISDSPLRILEFYSGIGAMRYALQKTGVNARVIEAFEINDVANDVYEHNFGHRPYQGNIQSLTVADLDNYKAHAWFLSPPCQPYTRQGLQKDSSDARAFSFLNILELIPQLSQAPLMLFVENVVGFEVSDTHGRMIDVLKRTGFVTQEFMLTPLQFGVPYSRPRYFCLAKRMPLSFQNPRCNFQLLHNSNPLFGHHHVTDDNASFPLEENWEEKLKSCKQIDTFLEYWCANNKDEMTPQISPSTNGLPLSSEPLERCNQSVGSDGFSVDRYLVPFSLIERWGSAMDIVYPDSKRCCCFTKSYYRFVKGTGSLLATIQPEVKGKASSPLKEQRLRYFTPREVANLHSFPKEFGFPEHVSLRQRYALLGNSMSIAVVAPLIKYLFTEPT